LIKWDVFGKTLFSLAFSLFWDATSSSVWEWQIRSKYYMKGYTFFFWEWQIWSNIILPPSLFIKKVHTNINGYQKYIPPKFMANKKIHQKTKHLYFTTTSRSKNPSKRETRINHREWPTNQAWRRPSITPPSNSIGWRDF
jgi:hypothetical protein